MRGRKPTPTETKASVQPCRERHEPKPSAELGAAPDHFTELERQLWEELQQIAPPGALGNSDRWLVETAVRLMAKSRGAKGLSSGECAQLVKCLSLLGCSPTDRCRLNIKSPQPSRLERALNPGKYGD
jgi:hypothetical protein